MVCAWSKWAVLQCVEHVKHMCSLKLKGTTVSTIYFIPQTFCPSARFPFRPNPWGLLMLGRRFNFMNADRFIEFLLRLWVDSLQHIFKLPVEHVNISLHHRILKSRHVFFVPCQTVLQWKVTNLLCAIVIIRVYGFSPLTEPSEVPFSSQQQSQTYLYRLDFVLFCLENADVCFKSHLTFCSEM